MKRLLSLSLLAVAMVSVTGCNNDNDDVNKLEARVETLETVTIESLKNQLQQMNVSLGEYKSTQDQLSGYVTTLQGRVSTLEGQDYAGLKSQVDNLKDRADAFDQSLTTLQSYVDQKGRDLQQWVKDYYITLELFNGLKATVTGIETSITTIISRLDGLDETTAGIAQDLAEKTGKLTTDLAACREDIDGIISSILDLDSALNSLYEELYNLIDAVQSVVVVPDYSDGSVKITDMEENVIRFEVYPVEAAQKLVETGVSAFSLDFVETETKASSLINIPVSSVSFDEEFLSVVADGSNLPEEIKSGDKSANARLRISDGTVTRNSGYFPLSFKHVEVEIEYVDLGLSVKWAKSNLCESGLCANPEDYGDYYAWGETEPYYDSLDPLTWKDGKGAGYNWGSYSLCNGSAITITKYNTNSTYGEILDDKTVLELSDDAAHVKLGGKWRMPTYEEWEELHNQCTWTWTTQNGVAGRKVTSTNGNSIFLPAAGTGLYTEFYSYGKWGLYWSSSLHPTDTYCAWSMYLYADDVYMASYGRYSGRTVRPVLGK